MTLILSHALVAVMALLVGLRWKHRRFLDARSRANHLERRMDAYRLADARTDLDEVGPVGVEPPQVRADLVAEYDEDLADLVLVASQMATDTGQRHSMEEVMVDHGITEEELDALPVEPDPDDTWQGTLGYLKAPSSDPWAPAAPARAEQ